MPTATVNIPSQVLTYANLSAFPVSGELLTIYIAEDTNLQYRWTGSAYQLLSTSTAWGGITGTLSNQTDLQNTLNAKEPLKGSDDNYVTDAQLVVIGNTSGTNTGDETAARIGTIVNGATNYPTPLDADKIGIWDVANSLFKALTWANIKATLKTYFDTLYHPLNAATGRKYFAYDNTTYTYTGSTNATIVRTIYIPAGSMGPNSTLELMSRFIKTGTSGTSTIRIYITTNPSALTGGDIYGVYSASATFLQYGKLLRITNKNSLSDQLYTTAVSQDFYTSVAPAVLSGSTDFSVDQYIHIYMTLGSSADTHGITDYQCYIDNP